MMSRIINTLARHVRWAPTTGPSTYPQLQEDDSFIKINAGDICAIALDDSLNIKEENMKACIMLDDLSEMSLDQIGKNQKLIRDIEFMAVNITCLEIRELYKNAVAEARKLSGWTGAEDHRDIKEQLTKEDLHKYWDYFSITHRWVGELGEFQIIINSTEDAKFILSGLISKLRNLHRIIGRITLNTLHPYNNFEVTPRVKRGDIYANTADLETLSLITSPCI
jgi:hypothetical protein